MNFSLLWYEMKMVFFVLKGTYKLVKIVKDIGGLLTWIDPRLIQDIIIRI